MNYKTYRQVWKIYSLKFVWLNNVYICERIEHVITTMILHGHMLLGYMSVPISETVTEFYQND